MFHSEFMSEIEQPSADESFSPAAALHSAHNVDARARRSARWPAWVWLAMGVAMPLHLIGSDLASGDWFEAVVVWVVPVVVLVGIVYSALQRVESRLMHRLLWPVTWTFVALVLLDILARLTVLSSGPTAALVVLGLLPAAPCFYGAWRVLRG